MVDLSKLPWGELKLPKAHKHFLYTASYRPDIGARGAIFISFCDEVKASRYVDGKWYCLLEREPIDEVADLVDATKLVDAFIVEHSKPKLPDVVPPEGLTWSRERGNRTYLTSDDGLIVESVPVSQSIRDAMLACCEAADHGMTTIVTVERDGVYAAGAACYVGFSSQHLEPGRYAVSFRRLPDGK